MEGLTNGATYSCYLTAANSAGSSAPSASVAVMPRSRVAGNPSIDYVFAISGKIIDGYISGATVYVDMNWSLAYEPGEPKAVTDANGDWRFTVEDLKNFSCYKTAGDPRPILADVPAGAVDLVRGVVKSPFKLVFLPSSWLGVTTDIGVANVTPFTTLFASAITESVADSTGSTSSSISVANACGDSANAIATRVRQSVGDIGGKLKAAGVDLSRFYDDFIATRNAKAEEKGKFIVDYLTRIQSIGDRVVESFRKEVGSTATLRSKYAISYEVIKQIIDESPSAVEFDFSVSSIDLRTADGSRGYAFFYGKSLRMRSDGMLVFSSCTQANPYGCSPITGEGVDEAIKASRNVYKSTYVLADRGSRYVEFRKGFKDGRYECSNPFRYTFGSAAGDPPASGGAVVRELEFAFSPEMSNKKDKYDCDVSDSRVSFAEFVMYPPRANGYYYSLFRPSGDLRELARLYVPYLWGFVSGGTAFNQLLIAPFDSDAAYKELTALPSNPKELDEVLSRFPNSWGMQTGSRTEDAILEVSGDGKVFSCQVKVANSSTVLRSVQGTRDQAVSMCYPDLSVF